MPPPCADLQLNIENQFFTNEEEDCGKVAVVCMPSTRSVIASFYLAAQPLPSHHLLVQPPFTPLGAVQPLQGLTKILRALTFAGHLAHPHQSVEVALCSICDTWKHGSIGHQIKGAELKRPLLQLCNPPLKVPAGP